MVKRFRQIENPPFIYGVCFFLKSEEFPQFLQVTSVPDLMTVGPPGNSKSYTVLYAGSVAYTLTKHKSVRAWSILLVS